MRSCLAWNTCAILLLLAGSAAANQYTIEIESDGNLNVHGIARLVWRNDSGRPTTGIPLLCSGRMKRATAGGQSVRLENGLAILPKAVAPGTTASLSIEFEASSKRAYGYRMLTGAWYPRAVTFRNSEYNPNQRQADDYDLTVAAPASLVIAASGEFVAASGQRRRWRLPHSTSLGLAASPGFIETKRTADGVEVRLYRLSSDNRFDTAMADYAVDAIAFYKKLFGFYPHPALVMLPGDFRFGGGYTAASGITVYHKVTGEYRRWIVAHEIAHQFWGYDTVIDDGDFFHWPGLALGIYSDQRYIAPWGEPRFGTPLYREVIARGFDTTIRRREAEMKSLHFDWNNAICHQKGYAVVRMLEDLIGREQFLQMVNGLLDRFRYQYLSFDAFQCAAEKSAGRKLDWFFHDWVDVSSVASFAIENVAQDPSGVHVRIRRTGTARFPVEVQVTNGNGVASVRRIAWEPEVQTIEFEAAGTVQKVEIDPRGICPMPKGAVLVWRTGM